MKPNEEGATLPPEGRFVEVGRLTHDGVTAHVFASWRRIPTSMQVELLFRAQSGLAHHEAMVWTARRFTWPRAFAAMRAAIEGLVELLQRLDAIGDVLGQHPTVDEEPPAELPAAPGVCKTCNGTGQILLLFSHVPCDCAAGYRSQCPESMSALREYFQPSRSELRGVVAQGLEKGGSRAD